MYNLTNTILSAVNPHRVFVMVVLVAVVLVALIYFLVFLKFFRLWLQAKLSRADVKFAELIGMTLRKTDVRTIVLCRITAIQGGLNLTTRDLESHYLAGGNVTKVVQALVLAAKKSIDLSWEDATTIDLDGRDVLKEVQSTVGTNNIEES